MRRPESHRTGELGEVRAIQILTEFGWIVEKLQPDYGFDLLIQRTEGEAVVGDFALVQVKASRRPRTSRIDYATKVSIRQKHLELWQSVAIPSFLVLVMLPAAETFILDCHALLGQLPARSNAGVNPPSTSLAIPESTHASTERMRELDSAVQAFWSQLREKLARPIPVLGSGMAVPGVAAASRMGVLSGGFVGYSSGATTGAEIGGSVLQALAFNTGEVNRLRGQLFAAVGAEVAGKIIREAFGDLR